MRLHSIVLLPLFTTRQLPDDVPLTVARQAILNKLVNRIIIKFTKISVINLKNDVKPTRRSRSFCWTLLRFSFTPTGPSRAKQMEHCWESKGKALNWNVFCVMKLLNFMEYNEHHSYIHLTNVVDKLVGVHADTAVVLYLEIKTCFIHFFGF